MTLAYTEADAVLSELKNEGLLSPIIELRLKKKIQDSMQMIIDNYEYLLNNSTTSKIGLKNNK